MKEGHLSGTKCQKHVKFLPWREHATSGCKAGALGCIKCTKMSRGVTLRKQILYKNSNLH